MEIQFRYKCTNPYCKIKIFYKTKDVHIFGSCDIPPQKKTNAHNEIFYLIVCNDCKSVCKCNRCIPDCGECQRTPNNCICCKICHKNPKWNPVTKRNECNCLKK